MRMDLTCPVELWRSNLPKEDYPACELMLFNLSDKLVVSCEVTLILQDGEGKETDRLIYRAHDLEGRPRTPFTMAVPLEEGVKPAAYEVVIEKVWYDDNDVWRRGKIQLTEYTSNALPNGRSLEMLRFVAGSNAVGYPEEQEGVWVCVCGRPNPLYAHTCVRCQRNREQVFAQFNKEAIEKIATQRDQQLSLKAKAAREDASRLQLEREQQHDLQQKKRRKTVKIVVICVVAAGAAYGVIFHGVPYLRYRSAVSAFQQGQYAEAQTAFADMGAYADAEDYVLRCRYEGAKQQLAEGTQESLTQAAETFRALGAYEDSTAQAQEADYQRGKLLLTDGDSEGASALFTALNGYRDSEEQLKACAYLDASRLLEQERYAEAQTAFEALGDYSDAADKVTEAVYQQGRAALAESDWDTALDKLGQTAGYEDTDALFVKAHYGKGQALEAAGSYAEAGEHYLAAGDYEDAATRATACIYAPAKAAMDAGKYAEAAELFGKIRAYEDSDSLYTACNYQLAKTAIKDQEFTRALTLLNSLPEDYEDVFDLKMECIYQPAVLALNKGNYADAAQLFSQITTYKDSADQLKDAQYGQAQALSAEGKYDEAIALFTELGDYKKSSTELQKNQYLKAGELLAAKKWDEAEALYAALGNYSDSATRYKAAVYGQAEEALAAGSREQALTLFDGLGDYSDAEDRAKECRYMEATELAAAGKAQEAAELFATLGDYSDADAQMKRLYYTLGTEAANNRQILLAARMYDKAGDYEDAVEKSSANYDAYYQEPWIEAQDAMSNGEYALVVTLLNNMDLTQLPERYSGLADMYKEANYLEGNRLYNEGQIYAALPYYRAIPDYKDVNSRLERNCYQILGTWRNDAGVTFVFNEDGTCDLNGEKLYFTVDNYTMETGASPDALTYTHKVSSLKGDSLLLRDVRGSAVISYRMTRVTASDAAPADAGAEDYTVTGE